MSENPAVIDSVFLKNGFRKGAEILIAHRDEINALNVFPVPDGDTGHNMSACVLEACRELDKIKFDSMKTVTEAIKTGTLMGARGNSGVILSQIFSGFCEVVSKENEISIEKFVFGLEKADVVSKSAVMKPVAGTILTLIEDLAKYGKRHIADFSNFQLFLGSLTRRSFQVVEMTREMMPKLKQAGVVDAGAKGLAYIIEGFYRYSLGEVPGKLEQVSQSQEPIVMITPEDLKYKYCTEFMLRRYPGVENGFIRGFQENLGEIGDSLVLVNNETLLKGHIHTDHPGQVFEIALKFGELLKVKVDNMKEQHESVVISASVGDDFSGENNETELITKNNAITYPNPEIKDYGFVAVSPGKGISRIFKEMNVDQIVSGGQTMNPSTADITRAIEAVVAKNVFVFPNNPNIILAAESASKIIDQSEEKKITVIHTRSVQEGIASLISFVESNDYDVNMKNMKMAIEETVSISVTTAVRNSEIGEHSIESGEYLFFCGKDLKMHGNELKDVILKGLKEVSAGDFEILTLYYGEDISEEEAVKMESSIAELFPELETSLQYGGQLYYPYYISLE